MKNIEKYIGKKVKIKDWVLTEENGQILAGKEFLVDGYWKNINDDIFLTVFIYFIVININIYG